MCMSVQTAFGEKDITILADELMWQGENEKSNTKSENIYPEARFRMSPDFRVLYRLTSPGFLANTDTPSSTWLDKYIHPDDLPIAAIVIKKVCQEKSVFELEHRVSLINNTYGKIRLRAVPLLNERKEIIEWFGTAIEIAERKKSRKAYYAPKGKSFAKAGISKILQKVNAQSILKTDINIVYTEILDAAMLLTNADCGIIQAVSHSGQTFEAAAYKGISSQLMRCLSSFAQNKSVWEKAFDTRSRVMISNVLLSPLFTAPKNRQVLIQEGIVCYQSTPLFSATGNLLGMLTTLYKSPHHFTKRELTTIDMLSSQAAGMIGHINSKNAQHNHFEVQRTNLLKFYNAGRPLSGSQNAKETKNSNIDLEAQSCNEKYKMLFHSIDQGFFVIDVIFDANKKPVDLYYVEVNETSKKILGADYSGKCLREIDPSYEEYWFDIFGKVALTGESIRMEKYDKPHNRWFSFYVFRIGGNRVGNTFEDITQRKRMEEDLVKSKAKAMDLAESLKETDRNKNQFISTLSHELRNPLSVILTGLELLSITDDQKQLHSTKEVLNRQIKQLSALVDDLLDLTRISNSRIVLKKERLELNQLALNTAKDHHGIYREKGIKLHAKTGSSPVCADADPVRMKQIIGNLLNNALKYSKPGGEAELSVYEESGNAVIRVKDNGIGLSPDIIPRLFQPFMQADTTLERNSGGLGLGLSIAKGIAELHGGSVSAFSEGLGKGSEFIIRLPLSQGQSSGSDAQDKITDAVYFRQKILIVDDNRDFTSLMCKMLAESGAAAEVAYDGQEGIQKAKQIKPDMVLCDIGLPDISGYDVARYIKSEEELRHTRLVALTGYASEGDAARAIKHGFDYHLAKPVTLAALHQIMDESASPVV